MLRCPNCESENPLVDPYACSECGLGVEPEEPYDTRPLSGLMLRKDSFIPKDLRFLKRSLTLRTRPYRGDPETIRCYEDDGDYIWIPRHFDDDMVDVPPAPLGTAPGMPPLDFKWTLDHERGQPTALAGMVSHLAHNAGGVLVAFTGCGKTPISYAIAAEFGTPIAILVYAEHMIKTWVDHAKDCLGLTDDDIGFVQEERCDLGKPVTIMMVQSLYSGRVYPDAIFKQIGFVVVDECHRYAAKVWQSVLAKFPARYRLGVSADPRRTDGLGEIVTWNFGRVGHTIEKADSLARPHVVQIEYDTFYKPGAYCRWEHGALGDPDPGKYRKCLAKDEGRNIMFMREAVKARKKGRRCIVFAHERKHLLDLLEKFTAMIVKEGVATKSVLFISKSKQKGEPDDMKSRIAGVEETLAADMVFTTYSMSRASFNKPDLDTAIAVTPVSSLRQPLGRLRDKGPEDRRPLLWLEAFETNDYADEQADRRFSFFDGLGCEITRMKRERVKVPAKKARRKGKSVGTKKRRDNPS